MRNWNANTLKALFGNENGIFFIANKKSMRSIYSLLLNTIGMECICCEIAVVLLSRDYYYKSMIFYLHLASKVCIKWHQISLLTDRGIFQIGNTNLNSGGRGVGGGGVVVYYLANFYRKLHGHENIDFAPESTTTSINNFAMDLNLPACTRANLQRKD